MEKLSHRLFFVVVGTHVAIGITSFNYFLNDVEFVSK